MRHRYVETEDLLLSLIHESIGGMATKTLESLGVDLETVRQRIEETTSQGEEAVFGFVPFAPQAKEVLPLAVRESSTLGHDYVGTEHILIGLIEVADGLAAQVLTRLGTTLDGTRTEVLRLLDENPHGHEPWTG